MPRQSIRDALLTALIKEDPNLADSWMENQDYWSNGIRFLDEKLKDGSKIVCLNNMKYFWPHLVGAMNLKKVKKDHPELYTFSAGGYQFMEWTTFAWILNHKNEVIQAKTQLLSEKPFAIRGVFELQVIQLDRLWATPELKYRRAGPKFSVVDGIEHI